MATNSKDVQYIRLEKPVRSDTFGLAALRRAYFTEENSQLGGFEVAKCRIRRRGSVRHSRGEYFDLIVYRKVTKPKGEAAAADVMGVIE